MDYVKHYVLVDGEQAGPLTFGQLRRMFESGRINMETSHYMDGYTEWLPLEFIADDFADTPPATSAPRPVAVQGGGADYPSRSLGIYVALGLFLGGLGIHNFYLSRIWPALGQLLLFFLGFLFVIPWLACGVWVIIELLTVRKDARGKALA